MLVMNPSDDQTINQQYPRHVKWREGRAQGDRKKDWRKTEEDDATEMKDATDEQA